MIPHCRPERSEGPCLLTQTSYASGARSFATLRTTMNVFRQRLKTSKTSKTVLGLQRHQIVDADRAAHAAHLALAQVFHFDDILDRGGEPAGHQDLAVLGIAAE